MQSPTLREHLRTLKHFIDLPAQAKLERRNDLKRGLGEDPGIERTVAAAMAWLCRAQDASTTNDGGVARHFSLITGWGPSYPETTGYIVPTFLDANDDADTTLVLRARRMLDWLVGIQLPDGGFQGGTIVSQPVVPVTFNTGQILVGLAHGARRFGEPYTSAMHRAAKWLVDSQDADGGWRRHATPFAAAGEKAYETHVAWGLFEAAAVAREDEYSGAAIRNIRWALGKQQDNGWFADCCLSNPAQPLTHTIGYALRGLMEAYRHTDDPEFLRAALRTAEGVLGAMGSDGYLPGRLDRGWRGTVRWVCLTGTVQIAHSWLLLYGATGDPRFREAAFAANRFVRRTVRLDAGPDQRGAVKGSFPVSGDYGSYEYLNWAAKFFVDANVLEQKVRSEAQ